MSACLAIRDRSGIRSVAEALVYEAVHEPLLAAISRPMRQLHSQLREGAGLLLEEAQHGTDRTGGGGAHQLDHATRSALSSTVDGLKSSIAFHDPP